MFDGKSDEVKTAFYENYEFFKESIQTKDAGVIWNGFQQLECIDIKITNGRTVQQIFESLNSTGKPLSDAELINNHILMPYDRKFQDKIEDEYWYKIEKNATKENDSKLEGEHLTDFFRHYLGLETGKKVEQRAGDNVHNIYTTFMEFFDGKIQDQESLVKFCERWKQLSGCYHLLLNPLKEIDEEIQEYLVSLNRFGESAYPFLMAILNDYKQGKIDRDTLLKILHLLETYYVRCAICGKLRDKEFGKRMLYLYKGLDTSTQQRIIETLAQKVFSYLPNDDLIRQALRTGWKGHELDILAKLDEKTNKQMEQIKKEQDDSDEETKGIDLEHIFPQHPSDDWNDGDHIYTDDEKNEMLSLLNAIGNWTLLEKTLNIQASNQSFSDKKTFYKKSRFAMTSKLSEKAVWDSDAIKERTEGLTKMVLDQWEMPSVLGHQDDPKLISICKVPAHRGSSWYPELYYSQAEFCGKATSVENIRGLFVEIIRKLWQENREMVLAANGRIPDNWQPIAKKNGQSTDMDLDEAYRMNSFAPPWCLIALQDLLAEMNLADQLFVKYATDSDE